MKLKYIRHDISDSSIPLMINEYQMIIGILTDESDMIVCFVDRNTSSYYIERIKNKFAIDVFVDTNLEVISDEAFAEYDLFFRSHGLFSRSENKKKLSADEVINGLRQ